MMSGDEFQSRYAGVMEGMLRSAVAETSQLFQTMVEELKAEMSQIRKENEELRSKCRHFEKKSRGGDTTTSTDGSGACCESNTGPGGGDGPPRDVTKCDTAIQCDLVPLQVGEFNSGKEEALKGEKQRESHGDENQLPGSLNHITFEEKLPIDQPSSNGELTAPQKDQQDTLEAPDQPDTAGDNESSCERGTRSQASGPENPPVAKPLPLVEKIEPQSQQISAVTLIASPTETLPESTLTKEKPCVTPAVDRVAEVKIIVQPGRRRGRPPKVKSTPADVLVDQGSGNSTSTREEKVEVYPPPVVSTSPRRGRPLKKPRQPKIKQQVKKIIESPLNVVPTAHKTVNHPSAHIKEMDDYSPLSPLSEGEHLPVKPNICQQLKEQIDEATLPSLEIPSVIETLETSSTELPKSPSSVQPSSTKFNRSLSYPTLEDAMLLIEAMNVRPCEDDDETIGNKPSVLRTTSTLVKPQHSPSQVSSQTSDQQSGPGDTETSAAPTLHSPTVTPQTGAKLPTMEPMVAQPPVQQFTLGVNSQSTAGSPNQQSNAVAQVKTLVIPTTHNAIVSPQNNKPTAMVSIGRRRTVVTPKLPLVSPQKIVVMPRSMSSLGPRMLSARPQTQLSTVTDTASTVVSTQNMCSPAVTAEGEPSSTQPTVLTVTLKTMAVTPVQSLSSVQPPQATAKSPSHSENALPQMVVLPQQMSVVTSQKCDDLASTKTNAADSEMTRAPTETCSSLTESTSSTNAQTIMPLPPVSPKKMSAVVKLTMLSLPALRNEILKLKRSPIKKQTESPVLQNVPSIVQELPLAEVESSQMSPAREQDIAPMSVTSTTEMQPCSKECSIAVQVHNSAAAKSSQPTSDDEEFDDEESTLCAPAPDTAIEEIPSSALLRRSSVIAKDSGDPHLEMTKVQFLAQLAVTPIAEVQEQAPFHGLTDTSIGTGDKKGVDENTQLKRRGGHLKPQLKPCKTQLNSVSQMEAQPTPGTSKKARLDRDVETPTKTSRRESSSSPCATHKSSCESIPLSSEKSDMTKNGSSLKEANDANSPVSLRRSRLSKNAGSSERTTNEPVPQGSTRPFTREGNRKRFKEPTPLSAKRPTLIHDAVRPRKGRLADGKLAAAANTKTSTKAACTKTSTKAACTKTSTKAACTKTSTKAACTKRLSKTTNAQKLPRVANAEKSTKADNGKRLAKATNAKALSKPTNVKTVKTARAVKHQQAPKAGKDKTVVKTENEETEIEGQHSQPEGESSQPTNNKLCQTGKTFWPPTASEIPPDTPVRAVAPCRPPMPIVSPLQPLAVIGARLLKNQCGECGRVLGSLAALESHVSLHPVRQPFSCLHCGKIFPDAKRLSRHRRVHRNGRIHVCVECGKGFVYTFGLTKHLQMVHGTVKPFVCEFCKKEFHMRRDLEMHTRIHTGEKPFDCSLCEKKFKRKVELNVHLRWHNGEKRHWCPYCGKGFLDRNNLKVHKYIHTGEKPHHCTICPKKFSQTGHLKKHLKNVHKV